MTGRYKRAKKYDARQKERKNENVKIKDKGESRSDERSSVCGLCSADLAKGHLDNEAGERVAEAPTVQARILRAAQRKRGRSSSGGIWNKEINFPIAR